MSVTIRSARDDERPEVEALVRRCGKFVRTYFALRQVERYYRLGFVMVAIDDDSGRIVGFNVAVPLARKHTKPWTAIYEIGVDPEARGQGIATQMIGVALAASPYKRIRLVVDERNEGAARLYRGLGFRALGVRENKSKERIIDMELGGPLMEENAT